MGATTATRTRSGTVIRRSRVPPRAWVGPTVGERLRFLCCTVALKIPKFHRRTDGIGAIEQGFVQDLRGLVY